MMNPAEYVGVVSPWDLSFTSLKREAVFFDRLAIPNVYQSINEPSVLSSCPIKSLEYLVKEGVVFDPVEDLLGEDYYLRRIGQDVYEERIRSIEQRREYLARQLARPVKLPSGKGLLADFHAFVAGWRVLIRQLALGAEKDVLLPFMQFGAAGALFLRTQDYNRRGIASDLRQKFGVNAYPCGVSFTSVNDEFVNGKHEVVQIVVQAIPEPDYEAEPWERILDFRKDPTTHSDLLALREWLNDVAKGQLTGYEIWEKLEYLCSEYRRHIEAHKMRTGNGVVGALLMTSAEVVEGLLHKKPAQVLRALYSLKDRRVNLLEAELNTPGREIAFVVKAREYFPG